MRCVGVIPVRMAATRFPGKPLARIAGLTMLEHVYRRACCSGSLDAVIVATCDEAIRDEARRIGAPVVMTSDRHERAAERVAEAAAQLDAELVVMIQGDEPLLHPDSIDELVAPFHAEPDLQCANLMLAIPEADAHDPDQIKVVCDASWNALYMSREPIPTPRRGGVRTWWRQIGIIAFRRPFLLELMALPPTPLERVESVDMLRAVEHGFQVRMVPTRHSTHPVDAPADVALVETLMQEDPVMERYTRVTGKGTTT